MDKGREIQKDLHILTESRKTESRVGGGVGAEMAGMNGTEYQKREHFTKQDLQRASQKFPRKSG